jgi:hypothetical protein
MAAKKTRKTIGEAVAGVVDEIIDAFSSVPARVSTKVKVKEDDADVDALVTAVDEAIAEFVTKKKGRARVNFQLSITVGDKTRDAGVVSCPQCGRKNRLNKGVSGALCGFCKSQLSKVFN